MGIDIVVGAQFGSEGKGHVAAQLASANICAYSDRYCVRVAGPNAGHTAVGNLDGVSYALRQIPVAAVKDLGCTLVIASGSEISPDVLISEVEMLDKAGYKVTDRLLVDPTATVIEPHHLESEIDLMFGSTRKGVGAARADRIMRSAKVWGQSEYAGMYQTLPTDRLLQSVARDKYVLIEGTQGYGLGLHAGYYPFCTSSDCRAVDMLAMAGVSPWSTTSFRVWVIARTFPIRVSGDSGPLYNEMTWSELREMTGGHVKTEYTTVTHKPRRVGMWDGGLVMDALNANGYTHGTSPQNVHLVLTFADYIDKDMYEKVNQPTDRFCSWVEAHVPVPLSGWTTGPDSITWEADPCL